MKRITHTLFLLYAFTVLACTVLQAMVTSTGDGSFTDTSVWRGGRAPVSGVDSVTIADSVNLTSEFTVADGASMRLVDRKARFRIGSNGHLTVSKGGHLDLLVMSEFTGGGGHLTIESGAFAKITKYWNAGGSPAYTNEWIADSRGVTTLEIEERFVLRGTHSILSVDLSRYDLSHGDTLILVDYGELHLQDQARGDRGWASVILTAGWSADLDLAYDIDGKGDLGIALTNIRSKSGKYVRIPEPGSYGVIAALLALAAVIMRHRRA